MKTAQATDDVNALISNTPDHSLQRKAAIAWGKGTDHAGQVRVVPLEEFDMNKQQKDKVKTAGTELDFSDGLNGKGFVFNNPNATKSCGCGNSFSV